MKYRVTFEFDMVCRVGNTLPVTRNNLEEATRVVSVGLNGASLLDYARRHPNNLMTTIDLISVAKVA